MSAGKLRHLLTIQAPSSTPDGRGGFVAGWSDVADVRMELDPLSGRDTFFAGQTMSSATHRGTMRYRGDLAITSKHRLTLGNRVFKIVGKPRNLKERNRRVELALEEVG